MKRILLPSLLLVLVIMTAFINLGFQSDPSNIALDDLPIGKLTFNEFINKYATSTVKIINFDSSTGQELGLELKKDKKYILIDTCQHEILRGRTAFTKRKRRVFMENFPVMGDKESSCGLSFLDDTLYMITIKKLPDMEDTTTRTDFTVIRDFILKKYFTKPLVDTLYCNPSKKLCREKTYVNQHAEIQYTGKKQALTYYISQYVYDFRGPQCTVSSEIVTTWYDIEDDATALRLWNRDTTAVSK